jgi:ABC-type multidrug transport system fused ATPase/permease subunit
MKFMLYLKLWQHMENRLKRRFLLLFLLIVFSSFFEVVTLGAVMPFLGILTAPEIVYKHPWVSSFAPILGFDSPEQLLLPITLSFISVAVVAGFLRIALLWITTKFAFQYGADLSLDIYRRALYQPYTIHVSRNSSEIISGITNKVATAVSVLNQTLILIGSVVLIIAVTSALMAIDHIIAIASCISFGGAYILVSWVTRQKLKRNSIKIASGQTQVVKVLQEGLGGIRDVLLDGTQPIYCSVFQQASQQLRQAQASNLFLSGSPRFAMESLGMVLIVVLAYILSRQNDNIATVLPILGVFALGAQRLIPAFQQTYFAWATIRGNEASMAEIIDLIHQPVQAEKLDPPLPSMRFSSSIQFNEVKFRYLPNGPWVLDGMNFTLMKGEKIAFVGSTGSGKSSTLDLLMGLLNATEGQIFVDGEVLSKTQFRAWQRSIAHVSQNIYLADATITQNIALGVQSNKVDMDRIKIAAEQAQIAEFIESQDLGYDTMVGERGVRLSGGQRQRIGIARALYKDADVLIFDEATSALDNSTEQSVMDAIQGLGQHLTIILIAHRLTTIRACNKIFEIRGGRVVAEGSYEELLASSPSFRQMASSVARS